MASAGSLPATAMPGDVPVDFAVLLAGLLGTSEPALGAAQEGALTPVVETMANCASLLAGLFGTEDAALGATQEGAMTPAVEAMADGASLLAGRLGTGGPAQSEMLEDALAPAVEAVADGAADSMAQGMTDGATLVPEMPPAAPIPPQATLAQAAATPDATGQDAMHPLGAAPSASLSPPAPPIPTHAQPDSATPAASGPHDHASHSHPVVATEVAATMRPRGAAATSVATTGRLWLA